MATILGVRHAAIAVRDLKRAMSFYQEVFGLIPYYQKDKDWAMSTMNGTSLSFVLNTAPIEDKPKEKKSYMAHPEHFGINVGTKGCVDELFLKVSARTKAYAPKEHRDGTYGFYFDDTEGNTMEVIYIPHLAFEKKCEGEIILVGETENSFSWLKAVRTHLLTQLNLVEIHVTCIKGEKQTLIKKLHELKEALHFDKKSPVNVFSLGSEEQVKLIVEQFRKDFNWTGLQVVQDLAHDSFLIDAFAVSVLRYVHPFG